MMKAMTLILALTTPSFAEDAMTLNPDWTFQADTVMGGVSSGQVTQEVIAGRDATRLTGDVSLENNGGFVQMNFDVEADLSDAQGVEFDVYGNGEQYDLRARTDALTRPWQSFRYGFDAPAQWTTIRVPFDALEPNRTDAAFDKSGLRRLGIIAVGREMRADVAVSGLRFYE
ncbi:CIA30 family protein [Jannaschia donghaensis]|uniref:Complex I intermediate-associated protein 30 (CIA30) n=1 Tax=Jannaschia donghaensis TaxID=420998 RepID=A0A0M6YHA1_9RHOB|nr:CIA30 family protein [Jannaschia donghaensis]CTQ49065.1 Complex I intermediate-associated protein 30 (CIA30) [Jannaschia donghaensis]